MSGKLALISIHQIYQTFVVYSSYVYGVYVYTVAKCYNMHGREGFAWHASTYMTQHSISILMHNVVLTTL